MKALLKTGEWVEIDTTHLFNDQYNTNNKRIFDKDIIKIVDDARSNMGKCRFCGAMVKLGEEEKHFKERENITCENCFWYRNTLIKSVEKPSIDYIKNKNDNKLCERKIVTKISTYEKVCTYKKNYGGCVNKKCREMGVEWFTPENTFFLKYPNGFEDISEIDKLSTRGFILDNIYLNCEYYKKIGSYRLQAILSYENGKAKGIKYYQLSNTRKSYKFRYENKELFTDKYSFGWYKVKTLEGIPENVMNAIKNICMR